MSRTPLQVKELVLAVAELAPTFNTLSLIDELFAPYLDTYVHLEVALPIPPSYTLLIFIIFIC